MSLPKALRGRALLVRFPDPVRIRVAPHVKVDSMPDGKVPKVRWADAARSDAAFKMWSSSGGLRKITMAKPKPIKWSVLATSYSLFPFLDVVKQRFAYFKGEVIRRLNLGQTGPQILEWYNDRVMPELRVLIDAIQGKMQESQEAARVLHNFRNRISNLYGLLPMFLEEGSLAELRILCAPPGSSLESLVTALSAKFENGARIETRCLAGVCFSPAVSLDVVMQIFENFLQNAVEHRKVDQAVAQVTVQFAGGVLVFEDHGTGMSEAQVERVNAGVRTHNGEVIEAETRDTMGHGYGIQTVHKLAQEAGLRAVYSSVEGDLTKATLVPILTGILVPDPMTYIFTKDGTWENLEVMVRGISTVQRLQLVQALSKISVDVVDAFFSRYMGLIETQQDPGPAVDIARRILAQYVPYLERLVGDDPVVRFAPVTEMCYKLIQSMSNLVARYSDFTPTP